VTFVFDFFVGEFHYKLNYTDAFYGGYQFVEAVVGNGIAFEQPQVIEMAELGQQVFSVKLIII
jgi:hypothetical protein